MEVILPWEHLFTLDWFPPVFYGLLMFTALIALAWQAHKKGWPYELFALIGLLFNPLILALIVLFLPRKSEVIRFLIRVFPSDLWLVTPR